MSADNENLVKSRRVFDSAFLQEMKDYLTVKTADNQCVTRTQLCQDLELGELDSVIGAIINLDYMPEFRIWMGPNGGIGRKDRKLQKKSVSGYTSNLSDDEVAKILIKVKELCNGGMIVPRNKVAAALGKPGTKTENLISVALKRHEFDDFTTKSGKGGGIYKISMRPDIVKRAARNANVIASAPKPPVTAPKASDTPIVQLSQSASTGPMTASEAPTEPTPDSGSISEEGDLSAPLDLALEERLSLIKSPIQRRMAYNQAMAKAKEAKAESDAS